MDEMLDALIDEERFEEALQFLFENENAFLNHEDMLSKKAWLFNRLARHEEALHTLEELKTYENENAWFYSELGFTYSRLEKNDEALDCFFKAQEMGRDDVWLDCEIASVYERMNYFEEAKEFLITGFDKDPENIWINSQLGYTFLKLGNRKEALSYYENAFELGRRDGWLLSECAWVANKLNQHDKAIHYLNIMNELGYEDDWCKLEYVVAYNGKGDYEMSLSYLEQITDTNLQGYTLEKAFALSRAHREDEALELYLSVEYKDSFILSEIAYIYSKQEKFEEERPYIEKCMELGRRDYWVLGEMAKISSYLDKDYLKAIEYLVELRKEDPRNTWASAEMAWNYRMLNESEKAIEYLDETVALGRDDIWVYYEYADNYEQLDEYEKAYEATLKAEKKGAQGTRFLSRKAYYIRMLGRYKEAIAIYQTIDRDDAWINNELGYCYGELDHFDKSIIYYEKALTFDPNNVFGLQKLAWTYGCVKEHQKAIELMNRCAKIVEPSSWMFGQFAYNYYHLGHLKNAMKYVQKALDLRADDEWLQNLEKRIVEKLNKSKLFRK